ncbi:hypothetical protein RLDS_21545 [Sphingobium lactosutens DS20]|uniref:Uncharacterized protein n=1 Tax=Sphingobium lactosutens DS20 TaxID=1331060 RepID=T0HHU2_9SPHN|nr:hypothetical protein RLDS_21545 [Sphingobium lactosutens DS20]
MVIAILAPEMMTMTRAVDDGEATVLHKLVHQA